MSRMPRVGCNFVLIPNDKYKSTSLNNGCPFLMKYTRFGGRMLVVGLGTIEFGRDGGDVAPFLDFL